AGAEAAARAGRARAGVALLERAAEQHVERPLGVRVRRDGGAVVRLGERERAGGRGADQIRRDRRHRRTRVHRAIVARAARAFHRRIASGFVRSRRLRPCQTARARAPSLATWTTKSPSIPPTGTRSAPPRTARSITRS